MSIKKEVILRSEVMTVYSSEMQERMKVYFQLQEKFEECKSKCINSQASEDGHCEKLCGSIFDDYAKQLYDRYKDSPEKLDEQVSNSPIFETRKREHTKSIWYNIFGN